jgi:hypothetical protein
MSLKIDLNGPLAASALKVAHQIFSELYPEAVGPLKPNSSPQDIKLTGDKRAEGIAILATKLLTSMNEEAKRAPSLFE